jgi:hypothetical protein
MLLFRRRDTRARRTTRATTAHSVPICDDINVTTRDVSTPDVTGPGAAATAFPPACSAAA